MDMMDSTDVALIERTLNGDELAFAELVRRYQAIVWGTVYRLLGNSSENEDAVQETFLRVFIALGKFNPRYPFGSWIHRIASNYCIDQLRKQKNVRFRLWSELKYSEQERLSRDFTQDSGIESYEITELEDYVVKAARSLLDELSPKCKAAFICREVEGLKYSEIAEILGTREITARVRVSRARSELRKKLTLIRGKEVNER